MAWVSGTCTGHLEFMTAMKTFLTANGWQCLADRTERIEDSSSTKPSSLDHRTLYFKGTGLAGADEVYIGFQDWQFTDIDAYTMAINGFTGFFSEANFWNQPGAMTLESQKDNVCSTLHSQSLTYWIHCNGRRVLWAVRVGSVYVTGYAGLFYPFCRPDQYPYPLFVGGNSRYMKRRYSSTNTGNHNFYMGTVDASSYLYQSVASFWDGGMWRGISGGISLSTMRDKKLAAYAHRFLYLTDYNFTQLDVPPNADNTRALFPLQILNEDGFIGELDGIYVVNGTGAYPEDSIADDSALCDFLLISNVFSENVKDYCAVRLERVA
jgi:hypothetical protein